MTERLQNAAIHASGLATLERGAPLELVETALAKISEIVLVWPEAMMTPAWIGEVRATAVSLLDAIGYEEKSDEMVEAAIMTGLHQRASMAARDTLMEQREAELEAKSMHRGADRMRALVTLAGSMRRTGASESALFAALTAENHRCDPPVTKTELGTVVAQVLAYRPSDLPKTRELAVEIKKALRPPAPPPEEASATLGVTKVLALDSDPPMYWLTIGDVAYQFCTEDLASSTRFKTRYMKALRRVPRGMPHDPDKWDELIDMWLASAETISMPPDASPDVYMREHISRGLVGLAVGEELTDLDAGKAIDRDGRLCFKLVAAVRIARDMDRRIETQEVAEHLRVLGCENRVIWIEGKAVRVWVAAVPPPKSEEATGGGNGAGHGGNGSGTTPPPTEVAAPDRAHEPTETDTDIPF